MMTGSPQFRALAKHPNSVMQELHRGRQSVAATECAGDAQVTADLVRNLPDFQGLRSMACLRPRIAADTQLSPL